MDAIIDMDDEHFVNIVSCCLLASMFMAFLALSCGVPAPYGRYANVKSFGISWGFEINGKLAWVVQECPSFIVPLILYALGPAEVKEKSVNRLLLFYFLFHYFNRVIVYPLRIRGGKPTPCGVVLSAFFFTLANGYIQGRYLTAIHAFDDSHLTSPQFIIGSLFFWLGMAVNWQADAILRNLRKPGETGYKIPYGGAFAYVSGANFLGEIVEWTGFAVACGGVPAATFALSTAFNVGPRAVQHHKWYLEKFEDYHKLGRKAVIPFLL